VKKALKWVGIGLVTLLGTGMALSPSEPVTPPDKPSVVIETISATIVPTDIVIPTKMPTPKSVAVPTKAILQIKSRANRDYDCTDFVSHSEAQQFFIDEGGPNSDPHGLDRDLDGLACETLP
jgi:hypothetical protein